MMSWRVMLQQARDLILPPRPITLDLQPLHTFDTPPRPVDAVIMAMKGGTTTSPVSREEALSVPAVQRGRNEICAIAALPLRLYRARDVVDSPLFRQFDPDVANAVHMSMTLEDLLFEGIAWWEITGRDFDGYPVSVHHIAPQRISLTPPTRPGGAVANTPAGDPMAGPDGAGPWVWLDGEKTPSSRFIRFDSPNPGLLKANARAIRVAILTAELAATYANNPRPLDYFTSSEYASDEWTDDQIAAWLADWTASRKAAGTGYVPRDLQRIDVNAPSPQELQLQQLKQQAALEIANGIGVDPEDLGVSTTSRTYFNAVDRRQSKVNTAYAPYMIAVTDRLKMGDVTRRGYEPRFDLTQYMQADPSTRITYYQGLLNMGVVTPDWIAAQEGIPAAAMPAAGAATPAPGPASTPTATAAARPAARTFDARPAMTFHVGEFAAAAAPVVDQVKRTITGLALPYGATTFRYGTNLRFAPGSLEYDPGALSRLKHLKNHATPVGVHTGVEDTPEGMKVTLSVLDGIEGSAEKKERDQLLYDAANGLFDGLSVGVEFSLNPDDGDVEYDDETNTLTVVRASWKETSTTPLPAFWDARVTSVAASATGRTAMFCTHCGKPHSPGISCVAYARQTATLSDPAPTPPPAPQPDGPPQPAPTPAPDPAPAPAPQQTFAGPSPVNPHRGPAQVAEPAPYVFDRRGRLTTGSHDFSTDLFQGWKMGDPAAQDRVNRFVQEHFAITPTNVAALNPNRQRPDLYVDQLEYEYPMYNALFAGTLADQTPFVIPKFSSSSGLVADHTTGTEPTPGAFAATTQTITPTPVSGKVEITREALDQGGNPQMSGLIWRQMVRAWYEALEAYAQAQLVANAASITDVTITTAAADSALDQAITDALVPLQYVRGGFQWTNVFTQIDLYKAMAKAKDGSNRRLYPIIGPQNANGVTGERYSRIDAHGLIWTPAWATAATGSVAASSWMLNPEKVMLWASAPQRIDLEWRVAWVDMGLWGYKAFGITDFNGARELVYDPV